MNAFRLFITGAITELPIRHRTRHRLLRRQKVIAEVAGSVIALTVGGAAVWFTLVVLG